MNNTQSSNASTENFPFIIKWFSDVKRQLFLTQLLYVRGSHRFQTVKILFASGYQLDKEKNNIFGFDFLIIKNLVGEIS